MERMRLSSVRQPLIGDGGSGGSGSGVGVGGNQEDDISFTDDFTVFGSGGSGGNDQRQRFGGRSFAFFNDRQSATAASIYTIASFYLPFNHYIIYLLKIIH